MFRASFRLLISSVVLGAASVACSAKPAMPPLIDSANAQRSAQNQTLTTSRRTAIVDAAARVARSVVSISVVSRRQVPAGDPMDFFSFFVPRTQERQIQGYGTGFVVRPGGIIITNQHVVDNADSITVSLADGRDFTARLLGEDPTTDIAVLKITEDLPVAAIGKSTDILIGEWVVALGNPYTYLLGNSEPTVTAGVVSATRRNVLPNNTQSGLYLDMIQTDASINPGNSGGPLVNLKGELIGVNTAIMGPAGGNVGVGFAVPTSMVKGVIAQLQEFGEVRRGRIGVSINDITPEVAANLGIDRTEGALIGSVEKGTPADQAGVRAGDVAIELDGRPLRSSNDLRNRIGMLTVGTSVDLTVLREGQKRTFKIAIGKAATAQLAKLPDRQALEGASFTGTTRGDNATGVKVTEVEPGSPAERLNLEVGDIVTAVNTKPVKSLDEFQTAMGASKRSTVLHVVRGDDRRVVVVP